MRAMTAATERQTHFASAWQQSGNRRQPEQQNQRNGEYAPHFDLIQHVDHAILSGISAITKTS